MFARIAVVVLASTTPVLAAQCAMPIGKIPVKIGEGIAFRSASLAVDADGAPNSYLIDGNGLSRTCDGVVGVVNGMKVEPGQANWQSICHEAWDDARTTGDYSKVSIFGFYADPKTNVPAIQRLGDPLPGKAFVSTTSLSVPGVPETSQRHWVDATAVPYIVLPKTFVKSTGVALGDVAAVYVPSSDKMSYAVFADEGPELGEASVKLHTAIGNDPIRREHGVDRADNGFGKPVITIVFPGRRTHPTADADAWDREIEDLGTKAFDGWGGLETLKGCLQ